MAEARVIRNNLVYVINVPDKLAKPEMLSRFEYFGQYGTIKKCAVNKASARPSTTGLTYGVYITYSSEEEAVLCIKATHGFNLEGFELTVTFGTTKYCKFFLNKRMCPKSDCLYLHELAPASNTLPRDGMSIAKHIQPVDSLYDKIKVRILQNEGSTILPPARIVRDRSGSEQLFMPARCFTRPRINSSDLSLPNKSRFGFTEEDEEDEYLQVSWKMHEMLMSNSPSKVEAHLTPEHIEEIMSPVPENNWAKDIIAVLPNASTSSSEEDYLLVTPKASS